MSFAAKAHEFWIAPDKHLISTSDDVVAALRVGQDFAGNSQAYLPQNFRRFDYAIAGRIAPVEGRLGDRPALRMDAPGDGLMVIIHETDDLMPAPIQYAHAILRTLAVARKSGEAAVLGPDSKSQLSVKYVDGRPVGVSSIVLSTQHLDASMTSQDVRDVVEPYIRKTLPEGWITAATEWHVNPTGTFVIGGPDGDAGLTGRKIIVDTYGGAAPHGGGAFSGKDPTKVDRSAAYAARYLAKNVVASGMAERCTIQLSYAIGVAKPLSIYCDTHGTGQVHETEIEKAVAEIMDLTPTGIKDHLQLTRPIYERTAAYGHFGRKPTNDGGFSWEKTDLVEALKKAV